jgi:glycosyltransferase involved in cell wall biosynthesis
MQKYPRVSVVVPACNEERNLPYVLPRIPRFVCEVILVDGHSTDATVAVARQVYPTIRVLSQYGRGKGDALRQGFAACTGDVVVMLDADGSTDPVEIPAFVEALMQGYDFAKGSRFLDGGGSEDITWLRMMGNLSLKFIVNRLYGTRFSDLCYGYNAFRRACLEQVILDCDGFEIETQLHLQVCKAGLAVVEVPSVEYPRLYGKSNLRAFRDGWRVLLTIFREKYVQLRSAPRVMSGTDCHALSVPPE